MFQKKDLRTLATLPLLPLLAACGDLLPTTPGTFTDVYKNTLSGTCVGCHNGTDPEKGGPDFSTQELAYATLVGTSVTGAVKVDSCGSQSLVTSGSPDGSYLMATLFEDYREAYTAATECSAYTHETVSIEDSQKTSITDWITNGANND